MYLIVFWVNTTTALRGEIESNFEHNVLPIYLQIKDKGAVNDY